MIYYESLSGTRGSWRNWLAHWTVDPGVAGSSPVDPANLKRKAIASWCNGSTADSDSACWGSSPCEATIIKRKNCWIERFFFCFIRYLLLLSFFELKFGIIYALVD